MTHHDITKFLSTYENELENLRGSVDLVVGGPPCQGFSFAGRRNEKDKRNKLAASYVKFVKIVKPKIVFFENVKGFTVGFKRSNGRGKAYSTYVEEKLQELGYHVSGDIVDFSKFGIPQRRKRFILVGMLDKESKVYFRKIQEIKNVFLKNKGLNEEVTLYEALSDLRAQTWGKTFN